MQLRSLSWKKFALNWADVTVNLPSRYGWLSSVEVPMSEQAWIPIGRGRVKDDLEKVIETLKEKWTERYEYRVTEEESNLEEPFQLLIKHR